MHGNLYRRIIIDHIRKAPGHADIEKIAIFLLPPRTIGNFQGVFVMDEETLGLYNQSRAIADKALLVSIYVTLGFFNHCRSGS